MRLIGAVVAVCVGLMAARCADPGAVQGEADVAAPGDGSGAADGDGGSDGGTSNDAGGSDAGGDGDATGGDAPTGDVTPDVGEPDAAPPPPTTVEDAFCRPVAELLCAHAADCGCHDPFATPPGPPDIAGCVEAESARCLEQLAPIQAALDEGLRGVAPGRVQTCLEGLEASLAPCEAPDALATTLWCRALFSSDAPFGAACEGDICAKGAGACTGGTCAPLPVEHEACVGVCAPGLLCSPAGACIAPLFAGAPCNPDGPPCSPPTRCIDGGCRVAGGLDEQCTTDGGCRPGMVCAGGKCADGPTGCEPGSPCGYDAVCFGLPERHCAAPLSPDAPCTQDAACGADAFCSDDTKICTPLPGDGAQCAKGALCAPGLGCGTDFGACGPLPGMDEPCAFGLMGPTLCAGDLGCSDGLCAPLPGLDQACTTDSRCDDLDLDGDGQGGDLGCDFQATGSFCVARKSVGGECQTDRTCKGGLFCDFTTGACAPIYATGALCKNGNECGEQGSCIPDDVGDFACRPLGTAVGDGCFFDCGQGLWCDAALLDAACAPKACLVLAP